MATALALPLFLLYIIHTDSKCVGAIEEDWMASWPHSGVMQLGC